ncbi:sister chromatid cohesion protein Dcc1 [Armillaria borealis]|uniref:Sister chromatid cohesion protein Dcc1 n=1 Tax=Armillaria borealis TaxID=47425 RepID=A0AA39N0D0_9AGAR|nr:sister chromatid cohesion protein Dcc1 [Armillaria borealis]
MSECDLYFSTSSSAESGSFKLIELPPDLCKLIESAVESSNPLRFTVRGQTGDDAVLCTNDTTYTMRSVVLSNSVLVVTPPNASDLDFSDDSIVIRDQVNEILELAPTVPRLHKLSAMLRGNEYDEQSAEEDMDDDQETNRNRVMFEDARGVIQASDTELSRGLRDMHILIVNGELRPIAPAYLKSILEMILNLLVSHSLSHAATSVEVLSSALADVHEVPRTVSTQVMSWFGEIRQGIWKMDVTGVVREVGLNILRPFKDNPIAEDELLATWRSVVGDTFESFVSVELLSGNYLTAPSRNDLLKYFPSSALPVEPAPRFADLFLSRSRWKAEDIAPFLADIAINSKERDKLLLKYARSISDSGTVWYTSRAQYNG